MLLAHGKVDGEGLGICGEAVFFQHFRNLLLREGKALHPGAEGNFLGYRLLEEHVLGVLEHQNDVFGDLRHRLFEGGLAVIADVAAGGLM